MARAAQGGLVERHAGGRDGAFGAWSRRAAPPDAVSVVVREFSKALRGARARVSIRCRSTSRTVPRAARRVGSCARGDGATWRCSRAGVLCCKDAHREARGDRQAERERGRSCSRTPSRARAISRRRARFSTDRSCRSRSRRDTIHVIGRRPWKRCCTRSRRDPWPELAPLARTASCVIPRRVCARRSRWRCPEPPPCARCCATGRRWVRAAALKRVFESPGPWRSSVGARSTHRRRCVARVGARTRSRSAAPRRLTGVRNACLRHADARVRHAAVGACLRVAIPKRDEVSCCA